MSKPKDRIETTELSDGSTEHRVYHGGRLVEKRITSPVWATPGRHAQRTPYLLDRPEA